MNTKLIGPFTLEAKVYFTNEDGTALGHAVVGLGAGKIPDEAAIMRAIGQTLGALPEGYELLDGDRFFNEVLVKEKTVRKGNFAVPSSFQFDVAALTKKAKAEFVPDGGEDSPGDAEADDCEYCGDPDCDGDCED